MSPRRREEAVEPTVSLTRLLRRKCKDMMLLGLYPTCFRLLDSTESFATFLSSISDSSDTPKLVTT